MIDNYLLMLRDGHPDITWFMPWYYLIENSDVMWWKTWAAKHMIRVTWLTSRYHIANILMSCGGHLSGHHMSSSTLAPWNEIDIIFTKYNKFMFNSYQQRYSFFFDQDLLELIINLFMSCYLGSISTCYVDNTLMSLDGHLDTTRSTPLHYVAKTSTSRGGYLGTTWSIL